MPRRLVCTASPLSHRPRASRRIATATIGLFDFEYYKLLQARFVLLLTEEEYRSVMDDFQYCIGGKLPDEPVKAIQKEAIIDFVIPALPDEQWQ